VRLLRVAHVTATFPPYLAGAGNVVLHLASGQAERGHRVEVFTAPAAGEPPATPFAVHRLKPRLAYGNAPLIPALARLRGFDLVHLHYPFIFGAELVLAGRLRERVPLVVTHHNALGAGGARGALFAAYEATWGRAVARAAARVCAVSLAHARSVPYLAALERRRPERLVETGNGVDVERFSPEGGDGGLRARLGVPAGALLVACVAVLDEAHRFKRVDLAIDALARARGEHHLAVVGAGPLLAEHRERALAAGVAERVHFLGALGHDRLPDVLRGADALVLSSDGVESFGLVLVEAMACARPVVTTALPGPASVVRHGETGLVVPVRDAAAMAAAFEELAARGPQGRAAMGAAARADAVARFAWPRVVERYEAAYAQALG
jgi:glycosyltransferase involved in cell wall biosynthesis